MTNNNNDNDNNNNNNINNNNNNYENNVAVKLLEIMQMSKNNSKRNYNTRTNMI